MNINSIRHFAKPLKAVVLAAGLAAGVGLVCSQTTKTNNTGKADCPEASIVNSQKNSNEQIVIKLPYELQTPPVVNLDCLRISPKEDAVYKSLDSAIDARCGKGFSTQIKPEMGLRKWGDAKFDCYRISPEEDAVYKSLDSAIDARCGKGFSARIKSEM